MLVVQELFKNMYFRIKAMAKKMCKRCSVLTSGFTVFALVIFGSQSFCSRGKNALAAEPVALLDMQERLRREESGAVLVSAGNPAAEYRAFMEKCPARIRREAEAEVSRHEAEAVCAQAAPQMHNELPMEPVNPYGDISIAEEDYNALCRIVQAEAGGEDIQGRILVAEVVLNRVLSDHFASSVYDVVFEKSGGRPQFSPTADGRYYSVAVTAETVSAVEQALYGEDISQGALFFSARNRANPNDMAWFDNHLTWLFRHGGHEFYTLP